MRNYAPIVIFACRRPRHLSELISSLNLNFESNASQVIIYVGGPLNPAHIDDFRNTIKVANQVSGFRDVVIRIREDITSGGNLIRLGVDEVLDEFGKVIVLEDDLIVHTKFLHYMNSALEKYEGSDMVSQISGWNFAPISRRKPSQTYLFPVTTPWGWATWKRAWRTLDQIDARDDFEWLTSNWLRVHRFNFNETYNALSIIEDVVFSNRDYYDVEWYLHCFRNSKLALFPNVSLVKNNGFDGSGLNFTRKLQWKQDLYAGPLNRFIFPAFEVPSPKYRRYVKGLARWYRQTRNIDILRFQLHRIKRKIYQHKKYSKRGYYSLSNNKKIDDAR